MRPLPGMRIVGLYPLRFDADLAVAILDNAGIEGVVIDDAHAESAGFGRTEGYAVTVRSEIAEDAHVALTNDRRGDHEAEALDQAFHHRGFAGRPTWVRYGTYTALTALAGPVTVAALMHAWWLLDGFFP